jgi:Ca2+/Na+ antiporter
MVLDDCDSPLGRAGGLAVYPLATLWLLVGMAFVAEEYFSVALEGIVEKYHVPDAVAGATVLAVGMSFPELIIGFVAQFLSRDRCGSQVSRRGALDATLSSN